jgi:hypothetical protein
MIKFRSRYCRRVKEWCPASIGIRARLRSLERRNQISRSLAKGKFHQDKARNNCETNKEAASKDAY